MEIQAQKLEGASRYLIAVWTVGAAFVLNLFALRVVEPGISPLFLLAVMFSAWRGGMGVGLFATILSAFASAFVFLSPRFSLQIDRSDMLQLAVFTAASAIIGSLSAARKQAEEAREVLLVKEQTARLEAERANRVKDEFLAAVSHELRTPLTTIKTLTRVMQRRELSDEDRSEYLADIASECDREIDLVLNLLDVSRIRAGGVQICLQQVDAEEILRACEKILHGEAEDHKHRIAVEIAPNLPFIRADYSALRRALYAVIENAIKFTPDGGQIRLRAENNGDQVAVEIEDSGRGIAEEDIPHIFEKFYRGRNAGGGARTVAEEVPGIGLGLNLAKTLVEGMNGKIAVESRLGKGTKFIVQLPIWVEDSGAEIRSAENGVFAPEGLSLDKLEQKL